MTLNVRERQRLSELIGRQKLGWLSWSEEQELRGLIAREGYVSDSKNMNVGGLVLLGLGILAAWAILRDKS